MQRIAVALVLAALVSHAPLARAASRWVEGFAASTSTALLADPAHDRLFALDGARGELVIIDTRTDRVLQRVGFGRQLRDLALSKNGRTLAMVAPHEIVTYDLKSSQRRVLPVPPTESNRTLLSVTWDVHGWLYVSEGYLLQWGQITRIDPAGALPRLVFGTGPKLQDELAGALLRTDPSGTSLFAGEQNISSGAVSQIDVSRPAPKFSAEASHTGSEFVHGVLPIDATTILVAGTSGVYQYTGGMAVGGHVEAAIGTITALARRGSQVLAVGEGKLHVLENLKPVAQLPLGEGAPGTGGLAVERTTHKAYVALTRTGGTCQILSIDLP